MSFDFGKFKALKKKREERDAIQKAGGGHAIAKALMAPADTDFEFGHNTPEESIDERIARESAERCMGQVVCDSCGKRHGYCVELTEEKEKPKMLPTGNEPVTGQRKQGTMRWLKNTDLSTTPKEAKILMVRLNPNSRFGGATVELKLAFEGAIVYWSVKPTKGTTNWDMLLEKFGPEENDWIDKRILFYLEKNAFSEQYYIRVDTPRPDKTNSKRA